MSALRGRAQASHRAARSEEAIAWQRNAACIGLDVDMFYPSPKGHVSKAVRRICQGCPVRGECLAYALKYSEPHGVWGGLTDSERRALVRQHEAAMLS